MLHPQLQSFALSVSVFHVALMFPQPRLAPVDLCFCNGGLLMVLGQHWHGQPVILAVQRNLVAIDVTAFLELYSVHDNE